MRNVDNAYVKVGSIWKISAASPQLFCEPKTSLESKITVERRIKAGTLAGQQRIAFPSLRTWVIRQELRASKSWHNRHAT